MSINLIDIADDLFIMNKTTVDVLFSEKSTIDALTLYVFYYKTAKWQKTNQPKVTDLYLKKSLRWGITRIQKAKKVLRELGLIEVVQKRTQGKIVGWYIKVNYIVSKRKMNNITVIEEEKKPQEYPIQEPDFQDAKDTQEYPIQGYPKATSGKRNTNALRNKDYMLKEFKLNSFLPEKPKKDRKKKKKKTARAWDDLGKDLKEQIKTKIKKIEESDILSLEDFILALKSKGYTYVDFVSAYRKWLSKEKKNKKVEGKSKRYIPPARETFHKVGDKIKILATGKTATIRERLASGGIYIEGDYETIYEPDEFEVIE